MRMATFHANGTPTSFFPSYQRQFRRRHRRQSLTWGHMEWRKRIWKKVLFSSINWFIHRGNHLVTGLINITLRINDWVDLVRKVSNQVWPTGWHITFVKTSCWHWFESCVIVKGPYTKTQLSHQCQQEVLTNVMCHPVQSRRGWKLTKYSIEIAMIANREN